MKSALKVQSTAGCLYQKYFLLTKAGGLLLHSEITIIGKNDNLSYCILSISCLATVLINKVMVSATEATLSVLSFFILQTMLSMKTPGDQIRIKLAHYYLSAQSGPAELSSKEFTLLYKHHYQLVGHFPVPLLLE